MIFVSESTDLMQHFLLIVCNAVSLVYSIVWGPDFLCGRMFCRKTSACICFVQHAKETKLVEERRFYAGIIKQATFHGNSHVVYLFDFSQRPYKQWDFFS